ncbi:MAG TPA: hypothetical protein VFQ80_16720, partial [Thermomicrobiales bacterium]|nr:hypothetical protein [Thermomicrobiales bacterium]
NELLGIFTVSIGESDLPDSLPGGPALVGLWTVAFKGNGTYAVARQDVGTVVTGTFAVEGSTITFNDWTGLIGCQTPQPTETAATYGWQKQNDNLTLTAITDACTARRILFTTRAFASYQACATVPLYGPGAPPVSSTPRPITGPVGTPVPNLSSVAQQEGVEQGASVEDAIDALLRQATGCWATQDPARFLPLHSTAVFQQLATIEPLPQIAQELKTFMSTPVSFERIGRINTIDQTHVWAYVEITFGGEAIPQRIDFAFENGQWLFDTFFLFGPPPPAVPTPPNVPGGPAPGGYAPAD